MSKFRQIGNPFTVTSPEDLDAQDAVDLFVDVFSDFPKARSQGHLFLHGPRGCGKSMIFRILKPDCQKLLLGCDLGGLPFYALYIPVKNTDFCLTEFRRLEDRHASEVLNEHYMSVFVATTALSALADDVAEVVGSHVTDEASNYVTRIAYPLLQRAGWTGSDVVAQGEHPSLAFRALAGTLAAIVSSTRNYLRRLSFTEAVPNYDGPLCGYLDFLFPLLRGLSELSFLPTAPIYLLLDDADNLSETQTRVLNSWVASRTASQVSLKISTQLQYKTYRTASGHTIDTPHDFSEVNISTVYTSSRQGRYRSRIEAIVRKRLSLFGTPSSPLEFFPPDQDQEERIRAIGEGIRRNWAEERRGYRPADDVTRYARPDFMKSLHGPAKSAASYSYAGFEQLVHLSSGIVRHFLEAAATMYGEVKSGNGSTSVTHIPPHIQDRVVRELANDFMFREFEKLRGDSSSDASARETINSLYNLISALGGTFHEILLSERSERRVFSIALSDEPSEELRKVFRLGERLGYFHGSAIGNKEGTGRTPLYVLSRRLAPFFKLDPTSFAGYLFATSEKLEEAMHEPKKLLGRIQRQGIEGEFEGRQLSLFGEGEP